MNFYIKCINWKIDDLLLLEYLVSQKKIGWISSEKDLLKKAKEVKK